MPGIMRDGAGLKPSAQGKRIGFHGPFAETRELLAGYWPWQVKDMDEALAWVKRWPNPMPGLSEIEIRPLFEMEDFGDAVPEPSLVPHERAGKLLSERRGAQ